VFRSYRPQEFAFDGVQSPGLSLEKSRFQPVPLRYTLDPPAFAKVLFHFLVVSDETVHARGQKVSRRFIGKTLQERFQVLEGIAEPIFVGCELGGQNVVLRRRRFLCRGWDFA
jgi:hypothetical protein